MLDKFLAMTVAGLRPHVDVLLGQFWKFCSDDLPCPCWDMVSLKTAYSSQSLARLMGELVVNQCYSGFGDNYSNYFQINPIAFH